MNYLRYSFITTLLVLFGIAEIQANDSTSYATSTGIEFSKNEDISIESETLILEERSVRVEYEFFNHSSKELTVQMAFPLPEMDIRRRWWGGQPETWKFHVYVDDKKYDNIKILWRALAKGVDKAKVLQRLGIAIGNPSIRLEKAKYENRITDCLDYNISIKDQELLINEGLAYDFYDEYENCLTPQWSAQAIYLWEAKFAPQKITRVKHTYAQGPGATPCLKIDANGNYDCWGYNDELQVASKRIGKVPVTVYYYDYVLHTGGNWKGPIKKLKLIAQGPAESWAWVKAPFPIKRESNSRLSADLSNFKPQSKEEYLTAYKKMRNNPNMNREDIGLIKFYYAIDSSRKLNQALK